MAVKPLGYSPSGDVDNVDLDALATAVNNAEGNAATALAAANAAVVTADAAADSFPQTDNRTVASMTAYLANNAVFNVKDYGAVGDGVTDDAAAIQAALAAASVDGADVLFPIGVYSVETTLTITNGRSVNLIGQGFAHVSLERGVLLRWAGAADGTVLHLDGFSQGSMKNIGIDGDSKTAGIGIHIEQGSSTVSQMNVFTQVLVQGCKIGVQIGTLGDNQGNNDQMDWQRCWWRSNNVGVAFCGDQAIQHSFYGCQWLEHNNAGAGAGIMTAGGVATVGAGSGSPNGGGFNIYGGVFGSNDTDMDIPRLTAPCLITGVNSENAIAVIKHVSNSGQAGRALTLIGFWQNSADAAATYSLDVDTGNDLIVSGCRFAEDVLVDNQVAASTPTRAFYGTTATIVRGATQAYDYYEVGSALNLNGILEKDGDDVTIAAVGVLAFATDGANRCTVAEDGAFYPASDAGAAQTAAGVYAGAGVPNNANGTNGDFYLRSDGTAAGNTVIYHREAGAWVALVTT